MSWVLVVIALSSGEINTSLKFDSAARCEAAAEVVRNIKSNLNDARPALAVTCVADALK